MAEKRYSRKTREVSSKVDCLILAGGLNKKGIGDKHPNKSLIRINGQPLIEYTLKAVLKSPLIDKIALAVPPELLPIKNSRLVITEGDDIIECVLTAARKLRSEKLLVMIADAPLVTTTMIDEFVKKSLAQNADFCTVVIDKKYFDANYPRQTKPFIALKEGVFGSHFNFFLLSRSLLENEEIFTKVKNIYQVRKNRFALASLFGPKILNYFIFHLWPIKSDTLEQAAQKMSPLLGFKVAIIKLPYPELAMDIDTQKDYLYIKNILEKT